MPKKKDCLASSVRESDPILANSEVIESAAKACCDY
jgi:hypothetical protein